MNFNWLRSGFYGGASSALLIGLFLLWLWQPGRQVRRHTENLFHSIEHENWDRVADSIGADYQDQWGNDRTRLLERMRETLGFLRDVRIISHRAVAKIDQGRGQWIGQITITAGQGELAAAMKDRVNSLAAPFELEWHRLSAKPWDWKLVRVKNSELEIPTELY